MAIETDSIKSDLRMIATAAAITVGLMVVFRSPFWRALLSLPLAGFLWLILFHGTTLCSLRLHGRRRTAFQVTVAIVFPLVLSIYFLPALNVDLITLFDGVATIGFLVAAAIITLFSWAGAGELDEEHPFRGFLIASVIIFVICYLGHNGIFSEQDGDGESSSVYIDSEHAADALTTGKYFGLYLAYVAICYAVMLIRFGKRSKRMR